MVVCMQIFFWDYLVVGQQCFDVIGFNDQVFFVGMFDCIGYDFFVMIQIIIQDLFVFGIVDVLQDYLFCSLCVNVIEFD